MHPMPLAQSQALSAPLLLKPAVSTKTQALNLLQPAWQLSLLSKALRRITPYKPAPCTPAQILQSLRSPDLNEETAIALIQQYLAHPEVSEVAHLMAIYECFWSGQRYQQALLFNIGHSQHPQSLAFLTTVYQMAWHDLKLRKTIIRAIGFEGSAAAVAWLVRLGQRYPQDAPLQQAVVLSLGYSRCATAAHALSHLLKAPLPLKQRLLIYRALGATRSDTAVETLRLCLQQSQLPLEKQHLKTAIQKAYGEQ